MSLNDAIQILAEVSDSPKKSVEKACEKDGKRAVGWVEPYAPEEIIYAAGCIPIGLWGGPAQLKNARIYLPVFACSIMQSVMEYEANGTYDVLSAVLIPGICDTLKDFGQKWKGKCPAIPFAHPQNRRLDCANTYLVSEYEMIRSKLEKCLGVTITDEQLQDSIVFYNGYRAAMREFTDVAESHLDVITPKIRHQIVKAGYFMDKKYYKPLVEEITRELRKLPDGKYDGKKVVVSGLTLEPNKLLDIFSGFGLAVVADDLAHESRQFRTDVPYMKSPMSALAKQWQNQTGCSLAFDPYKSRVKKLVEMVRAKNADGLVLALMKFCDPEEFDVPIIMDACKEAGIPLSVIEIDQQDEGLEQVKTRLQAFAESL
ncbi:2-hydroxyacyl-CoA dehydratase [Caproiciproducens sp. NJN-50]|uniref:2-hydroxyacyl-CoA dehydratase subunit D n=1 Tax=Acutalibacteraceae TaxID=3082771 RepID=UPI000FFDF9B3|nr:MULTISPECIES: 2-hydroxyacyl-CoA dehydratase family protein [Acutalibacteraceae]QAT49965.1 2-hydroxyacyl-CoA dehydratase [Caproiciproducens sp. NJN-50]